MADCVFCKIVGGELPSTKVYEDEQAFAFRDINPVAPVHILVVPKEHIPSLREADDEDLLGALLQTARKVAEISGLKGYRVAINIGREGGQVVDHLHLHVIGGKSLADLPALG